MSSRPSRSRSWSCLGLLLIAGCAAQDDARVQQLLNQRGFGARYVGDSNEQYYLGIGDQILVFDPGHPELNGAYRIRPDGVIDIPMIGEIFVAGLTLPDVGEILTRQFRQYITSALVDVQLGSSGSKFFYVDGQVTRSGKARFQGGETLFDVVFQARPTILADEDAVRLIRADPVNPLTLNFDYDDMLSGGWSRGNVPVRENDIIYVPPNSLGFIADFLQGLLAPLQRAFQGILQASRLIVLTETFGTTRGIGFGNRGRFGGFGFGGFYGDPTVSAAAAGAAPTPGHEPAAGDGAVVSDPTPAPGVGGR